MSGQPESRGRMSRSDTMETVRKGLRSRYAAERRFIWYGRGAIAVALGFLVLLVGSILFKGASVVTQTHIRLTVELPLEAFSKSGEVTAESIGAANYVGIVKSSLRDLFPDVSGRRDKRALDSLISSGAAYELRDHVLANPELVGQSINIWVSASDDIDMLDKGYIDRDVDSTGRRVTDKQIGWYDKLIADGRLERQFNTTFFTSGDSREPEQAGIWGAALGSFYTLLVTLLLAFPLGVTTAVYLEEFAPKNKWTDLIEVNINNLAAVPSIIFGLLGLAVFLNIIGLPRSAPLAGGVVLALMTLPTIIIAGRAALKAVPPSIREAALGVGASRLQTVTHHVLPLAMPGMLTGSIIGMAQALGETAPLLMIGMVAFIVDLPSGPLDPATVLPVQVYIWADSPERAFVERTSAGIIVLLLFLVVMNLSAVMLRKRFERRW